MRTGMLALVMLLTVACTGGPAAASPTPSPLPSPTPSPSPSVGPDARIIGTFGVFLENTPFLVAFVDQPEDWRHLWGALGTNHEAPAIDFSQEAVIFLGMAGSSSCPEQFDHLVVDEPTSHVYAEWAAHPPNQPCTDDLQAQAIVIAVARSVLPQSQFRLTLREELICADCPDHPDQVLANLNT